MLEIQLFLKTSQVDEGGADGTGPISVQHRRPQSQAGIMSNNRKSYGRRGQRSDQKCAPRSAGKPTTFGPVIPQRREDDFNERFYRCGADGKSIKAKESGQTNSSQASLGEIDEKLEGRTVTQMQSY